MSLGLGVAGLGVAGLGVAGPGFAGPGFENNPDGRGNGGTSIVDSQEVGCNNPLSVRGQLAPQPIDHQRGTPPPDW